MTETVQLGPACHLCRRRGVPLRWYTPIGPSAPSRAYCRRKPCQLDMRSWTLGSYAVAVGPVVGALAPSAGDQRSAAQRKDARWAAMSPEERAEETIRLRHLWARRISDLITIVGHDPETYVPLDSFTETVMVPGLIRSIREWLDRLEAELAKKPPAITSGLRLIREADADDS